MLILQKDTGVLRTGGRKCQLRRPTVSCKLPLETPGGFADVTEDIVRLIRQKYDSFAVIIAGWAKSAGTILAMAADEILMGPNSALGPIDAQMFWQNRQFSADALLE